jgi:N-acetyl sugar amidotransferase
LISPTTISPTTISQTTISSTSENKNSSGEPQSEKLPSLQSGLRICSRCIMDTSVPDIQFDEAGECTFCKIHDELDKMYPLQPEEVRANELSKVVAKIKKAGEGKKYDCVVGVSGGRDSTWTLYTAVQLGLRPLAVHFDNGWNSEIAVTNIHNATVALGIDLETVVADWSEFRDLQVAFLRASVPDVEVPTDVAIHSVLHLIAGKEGIQYILNGHSFRTEGVAPKSWTYMDGRYINAIQRLFGTKALVDFKNFTMLDYLNYSYWKRIKVVPILNYASYDPKLVRATVERECGWKDYGGHHHESYYTKFIQSYLLPQKFNIDKRKTENSALIRSGMKTREEALEEVRTIYPFEDDLIDYILNKLEITHDEWTRLFAEKPKSFRDYPSYYPLMKALRFPLRIAANMGLIPRLLYLKFLA